MIEICSEFSKHDVKRCPIFTNTESAGEREWNNLFVVRLEFPEMEKAKAHQLIASDPLDCRENIGVEVATIFCRRLIQQFASLRGML